MNLSDLPDANDQKAVRLFALSFNGYEHFGSFTACAEEARKQKRETLVDLRNELFFWQRGAAHRGQPEDTVIHYKELLPHFHRLLGAQPE